MDLARLIELVHRHAHRQWAMQGGASGVSHSEFEYLRSIREQEARKTDRHDHGQHLQDVVDEMGVRKASASAMVVKLEERGLVTRIPCQYDARAQHILLTEAGIDMLRRGETVYAAAARTLLDSLSDTERRKLDAVFDGPAPA
ncbi:MarR family transcriptional regulator [Defluviimonas sp. WL0024]|uniref:MarR family transcriptional regulator n=2 Tax=Albidovulum TaxID=205889 RepID=A0ABT3IZ44_9RHOB|nr:MULTISPECIES: MarR family transcriptional regulator [Defluviimonas]MCU9848317.1 MarR family transcriptional regulator [Defluviimonas sp. WL0024]MCW3780697.1 MarR family transcriptional regulator [Defluviimonas salinarum]